jgi:hypothetical protein
MPEYGGEAQDLARIRAEVEAGNTDLKALGFWRLLSKIKRDPGLIEAFADQAAAIDRAAFERRFRVRLPVWLGNGVLLLATAALVALIPIAVQLASPDVPNFWLIYGGTDPPAVVQERLGFPIGPSSPLWGGLALLVSGAGLSVAVHDLMHWLIGRAGGIRFVAYFLDGPFKIQPGLKVEYASYLRTPPEVRAQMHAAGAIGSKAAPFIVFAAAYVTHWQNGWELFPEWSLYGLLVLGAIQILTDVVWSTKKSDWKKWRRERRIAADLYSKGTPGSSDAPG